MLTIRGGWADIFWFSLFHEIGHLLLHGNRQNVILECDEDEPENRIREQEVDRFAASTLIPGDEYQNFLDQGSFYRKDIERFARRLGIDSGIVVGRLQHEGYIQSSWHNGLRTRYQWKSKPLGYYNQCHSR